MKTKWTVGFCVAMMAACVGLSQAVTVSWDGASSDITGLGANVNSSPNVWTIEDGAWNTTDEVVPAVGSQASFKAALGLPLGQRKIAQVVAGSDEIFVGGNELAPTTKTPYTALVGFDTSAFGGNVLKSITATFRRRVAGDTVSVRWFVEAGGSTYVSDVIGTVVNTTLTTDDVRAIPWFVFDADANIGSAIGDANSLMELSNVTRVGYYTECQFTADGNWHGAYVKFFEASTIQFTATEPSPADGLLVLDTPILGWKAGDLANAHDVYLDTVNPPVAYKGRQTAASYDPNTTLASGTYYWRIDEVDDPNTPVGDPANVWEGDVWSFTISDPGAAKDPSPVDGATGVSSTPTLSWTAGLNAISHDVWLGKSPDALTLVSDDQAGTTFAPGTLVKGQTYYWAVDEYDGTYTYPGVLWNFTVAAAAGTSNWTNGGDPNEILWTSEDNWSAGVPGLGSMANIHINGPALIDSSVDAVATGNWNRYGIPDTDPNTDTDTIVLEMTGGSLTVNGWALGNGGPAVVNMSDGTITAGNLNIGDQDGGNTTFNINGGAVNLGNLTSKVNATTNFINLNGGVLTTPNITLNAGSDPNVHLGTIVDISGGTLILGGNKIGQVNGYADNGRIIAYGGTGNVLVSYDSVTNKTTVTGCPFIFEADFTNDCAVNIDDLLVLAQDWLFKTPEQLAWSFDMATDPTGPGTYDLVVREPSDINGNYVMGNDTGTGTLEVTGQLLLDQHDSELPLVGLFDASIHYVVKSTDANWVNLWYTQGTSSSAGQQAYVGISTKNDGVQTVEIWTGAPPHVAEYAPVVVSGFSGSAYLDIIVNFDYETDTFDWTVTDGISPQSGTGVAYTAYNAGDGGNLTLQNGAGVHGGGTYDAGHALIDHLEVIIYGSDWYADTDIQLDGSVDLVDFAVLAEEWLLGGEL